MRKSLMSTQSLSVICNAHNHQTPSAGDGWDDRRRSTGRNTVRPHEWPTEAHTPRANRGSVAPRRAAATDAHALPSCSATTHPGHADRGSRQTRGAHAKRGVAADGLETSVQPDGNAVKATAVMGAQLCAHARHSCKRVQRVSREVQLGNDRHEGGNTRGWATRTYAQGLGPRSNWEPGCWRSRGPARCLGAGLTSLSLRMVFPRFARVVSRSTSRNPSKKGSRHLLRFQFPSQCFVVSSKQALCPLG